MFLNDGLYTFLSPAEYFSKPRIFFVRSFVRPFVLAFDRNGGARFGGARGRAGPHRFDQMQNESIFSDFWRRAAHRRQKSKKMRNENFAFFGPSENFPQKFPWSPKTLILHVGYNLETLMYLSIENTTGIVDGTILV